MREELRVVSIKFILKKYLTYDIDSLINIIYKKTFFLMKRQQKKKRILKHKNLSNLCYFMWLHPV